MESRNNGKKKRKWLGWVIALIVVAVLFGVGALFCAPFSPLSQEYKQAHQGPAATADVCRL